MSPRIQWTGYRPVPSWQVDKKNMSVMWKLAFMYGSCSGGILLMLLLMDKKPFKSRQPNNLADNIDDTLLHDLISLASESDNHHQIPSPNHHHDGISRTAPSFPSTFPCCLI